jgi:BirA family biotin operon repressor/biotin-[acetyl-CoA-carboxylase] ligase
LDSGISREAILDRIGTRIIGREVLYFPSVTSTMDIARRAATEGAVEGTAVVADRQTEGRARLGRAWINPPGVLAVSIVVHPEMSKLLRLTMMASLATSRCIERVAGLETSIKWPNDVLIRGKKVSGILTQSALRRQSVRWAIIGIGINVNFDPAAYPEIAGTATSLSNELGHPVPQLDVLVCLIEELDKLYVGLRQGEGLHEDWRNRLETIGKMVSVTSGRRVIEGCAESVDDDGALLVRRSDGSLVEITAGDVTLRT